ncbi:helix-turn-helix domain-containing protein [Micromonospora sp. NPDC048930]|uniref:helix-turn-helix domain-containing protein n=1 Tax=Micromonospora sp. NPDC048930 TaxID=3364261 RepID=UPI00371ACF74
MDTDPGIPGKPEDSSEGSVGGRIRRYRQDRALSLSQLAEQAGVSKGYLSTLENDPQARRPSAETLYTIARALGVTMSDLLGRKLLPAAATEIPTSLREFAEEEKLPEADVRMLSAIQFRGEPPRTKERWRYIYTAIRTSEAIDR